MVLAVPMAAMLQTPVLASLTTPEFLEVLWEARVAVLMAHLKGLQAVLVAPLAAQANLEANVQGQVAQAHSFLLKSSS